MEEKINSHFKKNQVPNIGFINSMCTSDKEILKKRNTITEEIK